MPDLKPVDALRLLITSKSEDDWNNTCTAIKEANGGDFPDWWTVYVLCTSIKDIVQSTWE